MGVLQVPGERPEDEAVAHPVGDRVEEGTPDARLTRGFGQSSIEQVRYCRTDQKSQTETEPAGCDRPRRRQRQQQPEGGQMVRG